MEARGKVAEDKDLGVDMRRRILEPLQTILQASHALFAQCSAQAPGLEQHGLPPTTLRDLSLFVRLLLLLLCRTMSPP